MLLSEYFYDAERLEPEIQDKLQAVLKDWQGVFLNGKGTQLRSLVVRNKAKTRRLLSRRSISRLPTVRNGFIVNKFEHFRGGGDCSSLFVLFSFIVFCISFT